MQSVRIIAGPRAFSLIRREGLDPQRIYGLAAAAGGPKWFTTYGLMKYVISELIASVDHPIHLIGASVGSWQMAAASSSDPASAIDRLKLTYCEHIYSDKPDAAEISNACKLIVENTIRGEISYILDNEKRPLHVLATRLKGTSAMNNMVYQGGVLGIGALANAFARRHMNIAFERSVFSSSDHLPYYHGTDDLTTYPYPLTPDNIVSALHASGAIPFVMNGVYHIDEAKNGAYWDGGITDYHMAFPFKAKDQFVILPHFTPKILAGWFDKKLPWTRIASTENMSDVIVVCPSEEYIASLPKGMIAQMQDFYDFGPDQEGRIRYWNEICSRSLELAEDLRQLITSGKIADVVELYPNQDYKK